MVRFMRWKASPTRVLQSSGSSLSAIEVDPAMSAKRTVMGRRSLTPAPGARSSEAELVIPGEMLRPICASSTSRVKPGIRSRPVLERWPSREMGIAIFVAQPPAHIEIDAREAHQRKRWRRPSAVLAVIIGCHLSQNGPKGAGIDGNRTHPGRLNSAPENGFEDCGRHQPPYI